MSSYSAQLREEQQAVSRAYDRLDALRAQARSRLDTVRAAGSHGSPTQRTERDSFATMYEDRLTQLRAVEDRLVFGRLDDVHGAHRYIGRIGLSDEEAQEKFGFMMNAFEYGAPPHGGLAFGLDRLIMIMAQRDSIRDVIAFPKTQSASDLMTQAPNDVDEKQLRELHIKTSLLMKKDKEDK